jgi:hypothetical protein
MVYESEKCHEALAKLNFESTAAAVVTTAILKIIRRELIAWLDRGPADLAGVRAAIEQRLRAEIEAEHPVRTKP